MNKLLTSKRNVSTDDNQQKQEISFDCSIRTDRTIMRLVQNIPPLNLSFHQRSTSHDTLMVYINVEVLITCKTMCIEINRTYPLCIIKQQNCKKPFAVKNYKYLDSQLTIILKDHTSRISRVGMWGKKSLPTKKHMKIKSSIIRSRSIWNEAFGILISYSKYSLRVQMFRNCE